MYGRNKDATKLCPKILVLFRTPTPLSNIQTELHLAAGVLPIYATYQMVLPSCSEHAHSDYNDPRVRIHQLVPLFWLMVSRPIFFTIWFTLGGSYSVNMCICKYVHAHTDFAVEMRWCRYGPGSLRRWWSRGATTSCHVVTRYVSCVISVLNTF